MSPNFEQEFEKSLMKNCTQLLTTLLSENLEFQTEPKVEILADSISEEGKRLTTFQLEYWRPIHSEHLRHRVFSINASSSRAKPISALLEQVHTKPWFSRHWGLNEKGMVASKEISPEALKEAKMAVYGLITASAATAVYLDKDLSIHKQVVNRLLEPFTSIQVVCSATEWENFYKLRLAPDTEPNMFALAKAMKEAQDNSTPKLLKEGQWHLPYITEKEYEEMDPWDLRRVSAARCARVSYKLFDGSTNLQKDFELAEKLLASKHMSPFEHQAIPDPRSYHKNFWGNFRGWVQSRQLYDWYFRTDEPFISTIKE